MLLAREKCFRAHGRFQGVLVLLNIVLIVTIMLPSYRRQVGPRYQGLGNRRGRPVSRGDV